MRSDIHALFDALLITLSEDGTRVEISDALTDPTYAFLRDTVVLHSEMDCPRPSPENIRDHRSRFAVAGRNRDMCPPNRDVTDSAI